ncbi:MAG: ABC transporter ATP-binding protein [Flavobacteriales bacterium]
MIAMKNPESGIVIKTLMRLIRLLPRSFRLSGIISFLLLFVNSAFDLLGLGAMIPLIAIVLEEDAIQTNGALHTFYKFSGVANESRFIILICVLVFLLIVLKNLVSLAIHYFQSRFFFALQRYFSLNLFRAYYAKDLTFFKATSSSKLNRYIQSIPNVFASNVLIPLMTVLNEMVILVSVAIGLLWYDALVVGLLAVVVGPTFLIFYYATRKKAQQIAEDQDKLTPPLLRNIMEAIYGYIDVKVSNTEKFFFARHNELQQKLMGYQTATQVLKTAPTKIMETAMFLGVTSIIAYGVYAYDDRTKLVTLLSVFAVSSYRVLPSVNRIMTSIMSLNAYKYTLKMIERESANKQVISKNESQGHILFNESINLENVVFSYNFGDASPVLNHLNLSVKRGEVIGVVGNSGSGKSTLMNMMLGFLYPQQGSVKIDGTELTGNNVALWRNLIGYVQQDVFLMDASLRQNIAFGINEADIDDERVLKAVQRASLAEFVRNLPEGIFSQVGERGGRLSGGQRQRVGIARAIYGGAQVLFFDEATSALDNETEKEVTEAIHKLSNDDLTLVIVAHRITTLKYCDRIIELENGKVVRETAYDDLIKKAV